MKNITMRLFTFLILFAATLVTAQTGEAQSAGGDKAKPGKKYVVRVLTIENGDTTVSDHPVDADSPEFTWVDDDGTELTAVFEAEDGAENDADMMEDMTIEVLGKKKYNQFTLKSLKDGRKTNVFMKKMGGHADRDCCGGGSCCMMDRKEMHGKTGERMRMHENMDKEEMMRMHGKMQKMWKEKKDSNDDEQEEDDDDDSDGNDGDQLL